MKIKEFTTNDYCRIVGIQAKSFPLNGTNKCDLEMTLIPGVGILVERKDGKLEKLSKPRPTHAVVPFSRIASYTLENLEDLRATPPKKKPGKKAKRAPSPKNPPAKMEALPDNLTPYQKVIAEKERATDGI